MKQIRFQFITFLVLFYNCTSVNDPEPYGALPSQNQLLWHEMEYFSLVCYGLNTYTEVEWAYGDVDPGLFVPTNLDTDQWAEVASKAGMKGLILVAKHHDGFCLWPSKYTDYSVKATSWKNGKGDILADLSKSCKKYGLKLGVYLSPWDRNHAEYGRPEYVDYYYKQLEELLTEYGDVFEFWIDGANGGTGYYGGAKERRNIDRTAYYGYDSIFAIVKKHQPNAVIFSDVGPGSRWVGNESGIGGETNWNTISNEGKYPGDPDPEYNKKLQSGEAKGTKWIPAEVNTTLLWPKAWYYHSGHQPRSLQNLMELYYTSIGRGSPLNLGIAIAPSGQIRKIDKKALLRFKEQIDKEFEDNLIKTADITASDSRNSKQFSVENLKDNSIKTYWSTTDSIKEATITISFEKMTAINRLMLQEYIPLGQRVHEFRFEVEVDGTFKEVLKGTTIGYKRIIKFDRIQAQNARIILKTEAPCLTLSEIGLFNSPDLVGDPLSKYDLNGKLSFQMTEGKRIFYAMGNEPDISNFQEYTYPIHLELGAKVHSYAQDETTKIKSDILIEEFSVPRKNWKTQTTLKSAIDNNPETFAILESSETNKYGEVIVEMDKHLEIDGFSYLPRQDGVKNGMIVEYEFYISNDGRNWNSPISTGTFNNIENNPVKQRIKLDKNANGSYAKLLAKSIIGNSDKTSVAEFELYNAK